jgi:hypothetical protein
MSCLPPFFPISTATSCAHLQVDVYILFDTGNVLMRLILAIVAVLAAALLTTAHAGPILDKLRTCLSIEDMTKERLDCYDAIVPPEPKAKPPIAKIVTDCRYLTEEDERLTCFNRFVVQPVLHSSPSHTLRHSTVPAVSPPVTYTHHRRGGCGSRGGAGYRLPSGKCASRRR